MIFSVLNWELQTMNFDFTNFCHSEKEVKKALTLSPLQSTIDKFIGKTK